MKRSSVNTKSIHKAAEIARRSLSACVTNIGLTAGSHHFVDLWARDSLFAGFGANNVGLSKVSKKTIETFLRYQREDGLIPFLIRRSKLTIGKYFGRHEYYKTPRQQFRSSQSGGIVPDGGLMTIIAARTYIEATRDVSFFRKNRESLLRAINWYQQKFGDSLIREWFQCEWADAVLKTGSTLYTNVLYWKALGDVAWMLRKIVEHQDAREFIRRQEMVGQEIRAQLWSGIYFADWKNVWRHDYFAAHANMLAIIFGFASPAEATSMLSYAASSCWRNFTLETNDPKYPIWRIAPINHVTGTADYHNRGCLWLQPGILYAMALQKIGKHDKAIDVLEVIAKKIIEYDGVYEVYEKTGEPVQRLFYRAEHPFAWSAGLFLWAAHEMVN
ncbi:hypothetical protein KJZ67_01115 [Patescibacteria group bacterium]|nr:hypothetical protein [Patescibacteria group bacterium]